MAVRLVTRDDLGPAPSVRTGRAIANFDVTPVARGQMQLASGIEAGGTAIGRGISQLGNTFAEIGQRQEAYETEAKLQKFKWDEALGFEKAQRNIDPTRVGSFADDWTGGYRDRASAFLESVPERLKGKVHSDLYGVGGNFRIKAFDAQFAEQKRVSVNTLDDVTANIYTPKARNVATADLDTVVGEFDDLLRQNPNLTPAEKDEQRRKILPQLGAAHLDALPPADAMAVLEAAQRGEPVPEAIASLDDAQRDALMNRIVTKNNQMVRDSQSARKEEMKLAIVNGELTNEEAILNDGGIDDGQKAELIGSLRAEVKRREEVSYITSVTGSGGAMNIYDPNQKKALEKIYQDGLGAVPQEKRTAFAVDMVRQYGYAPDSLVKDIRSGLVSQDAETLQTSLALTDEITRINPNAFAGRDGAESLSKAGDFVRSHRELGYPEDMIALKYQQSKDEEFQRKRKALLDDKPIKDWIKSTAEPKDVLDVFDTSLFWGGEPEFVNDAQQASITAEYKSLLEDAIVETGGDKDAAKKMADARLANVYGASELNIAGRDVLMRRPPERYYPKIDGGHGYVTEQLRSLVANVEGVNPESVFLQADEVTEGDIKAGRMPRYQVWYVDEFGRFQALLGGHFVADVDDANKPENRKRLSPRELNEIDRYMQQNPLDYSNEVP